VPQDAGEESRMAKYELPLGSDTCGHWTEMVKMFTMA
jgi:hypothetical protein